MLKLNSKSLLASAASGTAAVGAWGLISSINNPKKRRNVAIASIGAGAATWMGAVSYQVFTRRPSRLIDTALTTISSGLLVGGIGTLIHPMR